MKKQMNQYLTKCHPDFHMPGDAIIGEGFDAEQYVSKLKAASIDLVVFFGKCHYGFSYYFTKVGTVHPGLKLDMLGEISKSCKKAGLGIGAYYSVFLDTQAVIKNPEWRLVADSMEIEGGFNSKKYEPICVNSGYVEELMIPQVLEIIKNYDVDEVFFDTMTGFHPCYCKNCVRLFGKPIPTDNSDPNWLEYVKWYKECFDQCFAKTTKAVYDYNPDIGVSFNWQWSANQPNEPVSHIARLAGDLHPSATFSSFFSRYWAGTDYPFDYMCGRFLHGLGDWSPNLPQTLKNVSASAIANGGSFYLIDRQLPGGDLEERSWPLLKEVFNFVNARRHVVENTKHLPETAVLYSYDHIMGAKLENYPDDRKREYQKASFTAINDIFMNWGRHFTALSKEKLIEKMENYRVIILPETENVDVETKTKLMNFVKKGGRLLIIQSPNGIDSDYLEMAGVTFERYNDLNYGYLNIEENGYQNPILIRGKIGLVKAKPDTETLYVFTPPLPVGESGSSFGHGFAPPTQPSNYSMVTRRMHGQGHVVYVSGPILHSHDEYYNPYIAQLLLELSDIPDPVARIKTNAQVEMALVRKENDLIIHLVNHSGKEVLAGYWCPIVDYVPEIRDIELEIKKKDCIKGITHEPEGIPLDYVVEGNQLKLTLPKLDIMSSILVKSYFELP